MADNAEMLTRSTLMACLCMAIVLAMPTSGIAHQEPTDRLGCHYDLAAGYHCHGSQVAPTPEERAAVLSEIFSTPIEIPVHPAKLAECRQIPQEHGTTVREAFEPYFGPLSDDELVELCLRLDAALNLEYPGEQRPRDYTTPTPGAILRPDLGGWSSNGPLGERRDDPKGWLDPNTIPCLTCE